MSWMMKLRNLNRSKIAILGCLLLGTFACQNQPQNDSRVTQLPYYDNPSFTPQWLTNDDNALANFHAIPRFNLVNQEGQTITEGSFANKIYVADFFFTSCPGICPKMTDNMALLQEAFKDDDELLLLSHSVTPNRDSVPELKKYAIAKGVSSDKWHLVTGDRAHIYDLGRNYYFVEEDLGVEKEAEDFLHTENFVLIDRNRHIRGIYNGLNKTAIQQLITDIHTLKQESANLLSSN